MSTIWVTGARGFIGDWLARHLLAPGATIVGIGHGSVPPEVLSRTGLSRWINADVGPEALTLAMRDHGRPDDVYHLAGGSSVGISLQSPYEDFARTTVTTARLLDWLRTSAPDARLVVASSAAVYGNTGSAPATESQPGMPESPYGFHKLMMEIMCREYARVFGLRIAIVRLFSVYGELLRKQLLWDVGTRLRSGIDPIVLGGTGDELRDWIHVQDAVRVLQLSRGIASRECPVVNGGTGKGTAVRQIVDMLAEALQKPVRFEFSGLSRPGDPRVLVADPGWLKSAGFEFQVALPDGLRRYARWLSESGAFP